MARLKPLLIPLLLFFFSFILRLSLISKGPYHIDCLDLALRSKATLETFQIHNLFGAGYPLAIILGAVFQFFARFFSIDDPVIVVNFMSVVFSSLCVLFNYTITRKLFDGLTALISSIMLSVTPIFLGVSTYGISHPPALFFFLLAIDSLLYYHKTQKRGYLYASSIFFGLLGATRAQDMILLSIPLSYLFFVKPDGYKESTGGGTPKILLFGLACLMAAATTFLFHLPLLWAAPQTGYYHQLSFFFKIGLWENFQGLFSKSLWDSVNDFKTSLTLPGIFTVILGFIYTFKNKPRTALFLFLWFLVPTSFYGNLLTTVSRFFAIIMPPLLMAQAYFLTTLIKKNPILRGAAIVILLVIISITSYQVFPILLFRHENALLVDFAHWVKNMTEPNARIITIDINSFMEYYADRRTLNRPAYILRIPDDELQNFKNELDRLLKAGTPVYITAPGLYNYDPERKFSRLIMDNYNLKYLGGKKVEEWYLGCIRQTLNFYWLFKITPRNSL